MKIFNIKDYGAIPDINELQTDKIQTAIDDCFLSGGGVVEIPDGEYLTGSIRIRSNVTLHLLKNAVLKGSKNPEDYFQHLYDEIEPLSEAHKTDKNKWLCSEETKKDGDQSHLIKAGSRWNNALIRAIEAENIAIIGEEGAVIDGNDCYDEFGEQHFRGPHAISFFLCKNIVCKGYTVINSANWAHNAFFSENITVENVTVLAGHDGVHCTDCKNIYVADCVFHTGDDCYSGLLNENVKIQNCIMSTSCNAIRIGGCNVLVENCKLSGPCRYPFRARLSLEVRQGLKNETREPRPFYSVVTIFGDYTVNKKLVSENIAIRNCEIECANRLLDYNFSGSECWQQNNPLSSIKFENIKMTGMKVPILLYGDKDIPVTAEFKNMRITMEKGFEDTDFMHICNYKQISLENITLENFEGDTVVKKWSDGDIKLDNVSCKCKLIKDAEEEFKVTYLPL